MLHYNDIVHVLNIDFYTNLRVTLWLKAKIKGLVSLRYFHFLYFEKYRSQHILNLLHSLKLNQIGIIPTYSYCL